MSIKAVRSRGLLRKVVELMHTGWACARGAEPVLPEQLFSACARIFQIWLNLAFRPCGGACAVTPPRIGLHADDRTDGKLPRTYWYEWNDVSPLWVRAVCMNESAVIQLSKHWMIVWWVGGLQVRGRCETSLPAVQKWTSRLIKRARVNSVESFYTLHGTHSRHIMNKKLSCGWEIARRICANAMMWLT